MADPRSVTTLLDDLRAESDGLDRLVAGLSAARWALPTPAEGWTVAHQIAHLHWTDGRALLAVEDPDRFTRELAVAAERWNTLVDEGAAAGAELPPDVLLARWRAGRARLAAALDGQPSGIRFPWYGPPMSTGAMAGGRLMETWAHGEDVADALGVSRPPTARLWHVARIAVAARDYAFAAHARPVPTAEFRVELTAPDGTLWTFGPPDAAQRVSGSALGFCLLAVRRRHRDDVAVVAKGPDARTWLSVAQAFAGPPGEGRAAGQLPGAAVKPAGAGS
ncbi:TIGR03084 family metal-binding protein [Streptomyces sp. NBC_01190]|uniref:TIGR03084 family metal-binding protein n=1 Tax=Streptomyces sp. NBC_01190 TaxID=2903767 RepID=UPI0038701385|nr:TIGR03084 family metal-binding protein [Streptomyces sp. NBC_01190]